ncbi:MAG: c-type cytochrome [Magnetovibrio sp.]|nr:c-type cytochrome [Magnetovibrio sp.]
MRLHTGIAVTFTLTLGLMWVSNSYAEEQASVGEPSYIADEAYIEDGQDIYVVCAPCHGPEGQGGAKGDYPRLAGMPYEYMKGQLESFKARERINIPMFPFTVERELGAQDIKDVSAYITEMELNTRLPDMGENVDGYVRLMATKSVLQIPRAEGDTKAGEAIYKEACARCHGDHGEGRAPHDPPLSGQFTKYLKKQFKDMVNEERYHPKLKKLITPLSETDVTNLLAYFSILDD